MRLRQPRVKRQHPALAPKPKNASRKATVAHAGCS